MSPPNNIDGVAITLRLVEVADAAFLYGLRIDPELSRYLSPVSGGVETQADWIASYKEREVSGREAYYVVESGDGHSCGTVRLYDIQDDVFTWGSFVLTEAKPAKAAIDVAVASLGIGFSDFGCTSAEIDAKTDNKVALGFYDRFGMTRFDEKDGSILMRYDKTTFEANRERLLEIVHNAHA